MLVLFDATAGRDCCDVLGAAAAAAAATAMPTPAGATGYLRALLQLRDDVVSMRKSNKKCFSSVSFGTGVCTLQPAGVLAGGEE